MTGATGPRVRVLIVDGDSALRQGLTRHLGEQPGVEVVGWATTGKTAQPKVNSFRPDLVLVDLASPPGDGLELLQYLHEQGSGARKVLLATAATGPDVLAKAAALGAAEVVRRAEGAFGDAEIAQLAREIGPVIVRVGASTARPVAAAPAPVHSSCPVSPRRAGGRMPQIVAIGVSTGGPKALTEVLQRLPADFPLPIVIVQHMPPKFTASLAESLDRICALRVREAKQGDRLVRGEILIAPGGKHLRIVKADLGEMVDLTEDPPLCSCRPSVDYLFQSLRPVYGGRVLGVVLTGMGEDGWVGSKHLHEGGACLLAQDEASSTVFGMPRGPIRAGIATAVPLTQMAEAIQLAAKGNSCS